MPGSGRVIALTLCLLALVAMFVLGGAGFPMDPSPGLGPEDEELAIDYNAHVGSDLASSGIVIDAESNLIEIETDASNLVITLQIDDSHDVTLTEGDHVSFSGTIEADHTITVTADHNIWVSAPWERAYMYGVSVLAAALTALLAANYWTINPARLVIEPREQPLVPLLQEDRTDG